MTITEATRRAMAEGKNIARRWYDRRIIIKPETSPDSCLISDAWEVTGDWYEP